MALKVYKAEVGKSWTLGKMKNNRQIREQNQDRGRGFGRFGRDFGRGRGRGGGREAAKLIQEEEKIVEGVEVIPEEVNYNRSLEQFMDLDSSTSEMEPG